MVAAKPRIVPLNGPFATQPGDLLVYLDETGEETLSDPTRTMFGFGGCAVTEDRYFPDLATPWRSLKRQHFGSEDARLHAAATPPMTKEQMAAIGDFFRQQPFFRIAAIMTP